MGDQRSDTVDGLDGRRNDCQLIRLEFWDFVVHARPGRDMVSGGDDWCCSWRFKVQRLYGVSDLV